MTAATSQAPADSPNQVQVIFKSRTPRYLVPDTPILIPVTLRRYGLSEILNLLLGLEKPVPFDFIINGVFLKSSLEKYLAAAEISLESIITLEYIESTLPPKLEASFQHDDWVSSVQPSSSKINSDPFILTGSYDGHARLWDQSGSCKLNITCHEQPIKSIAILNQSSSGFKFVSASMDHTLRVVEVNQKKHGILFECLGHTASVETVAVSPSGHMFMSGSFDGSIKLWTPQPPTADDEIVRESKPTSATKKRKMESATIKAKGPIATLRTHTDRVADIKWMNESIVYSASWDHSIRAWDPSNGLCTQTISSGKAFHALAVNPASNIIASGQSDYCVRIWDPKAPGGKLSLHALHGHTLPVSSISFCPTQDQLLCSGSHDGSLRIWDLRSPKHALHIMTVAGDGGKVLCNAWQNGVLHAGTDQGKLVLFDAKSVDQSMSAL